MLRENRVMLVEGDKEYGEMLKGVLESEQYIVDYFEKSMDAVVAIEKNKYQLVVSDLKMEVLNGIQLLQLVKKISPRTRTMILTAFPYDAEKIRELNMVVDKYVTKDIRMDILIGFIEYLVFLASTSEEEDSEVLVSKAEGITLDWRTREVRQNNIKVKLTMKQFAILQYFLENKGRSISREEFIDNLWDKSFEKVDPRNIDGYISELRRKLKIQSIFSIRGHGYKWSE